MQGNLLVTPEKLITASNEFRGKASEVQGITTQMMELVHTLTSSSWTGEASSAYSAQFNKLEDDMNKLYKMIQEHSSDLNDMAKNYQNAEIANQNIASGLPADAIS